MEHKFLSGVSVFDFLTMVVPGGLIMAIVGNCIGYEPFYISFSEPVRFAGYIAVLVAAYMIGIIYNSLMELIFNLVNFRNNKWGIWCAYRRIKKKICQSKLWTLENLCILEKCNKANVLNGYYTAYYFVASNQINSSISIMECQVAFIRNMFLPILLMGVVECMNVVNQSYEMKLAPWCFWLTAILLFIVMSLRQFKIYKRVFEDYVYLKSMK